MKCGHRELLGHTEKRVGSPPKIQDSFTGTNGYIQLHRRIL